MTSLTLEMLPGEYSVYRLPPDRPVPSDVAAGFLSITRTDQELSIIARSGALEQYPVDWDSDCRVEAGFRGLRVVGPLAFEVTGILAQLSSALAAAEIPLLAIATFDTDYVFLAKPYLAAAQTALRQAGCTWRDTDAATGSST